METQTLKISREQIQQEALMALEKNGGTGTLNIDTGVGKSKIVIDFIRRHKDVSRVLIASPRTNLKANWTKEFEKWLKEWVVTVDGDTGILEAYDETDKRTVQVTLVNVQTAYKWPDTTNPPVFDLVVGDEVHTQMTPEYSNIFKLKKRYLICLTATTDTKGKEDKQELYEKYAPIIYVYNEAEEDNIVNKVNIVTVSHVLDNFFKVPAGSKKKPFMQGEAAAYNYLTAQIKKGQMLMAMQGSEDFFTDAANWFWKGLGTAKQKEAARVYLSSITKRRSMLLNLSSSRTIASRLTGKLYEADKRNKILVFSEMTGQADLICKYTVHSNNSAEANARALSDFNEGHIRILGSCYSLTLGLNMSAANIAIYESYQGSETLAIQRKGRLHRLHPDQQATIYVFRAVGTQMDTWMRSFVDQSQISENIDSRLILSGLWKP